MAYNLVNAMNTAVSAGGILTKKENGKTYLLLIYYTEYRDLGFVKGHVEKGETVEQTAVREVKEEVGLKNAVIVKKLGALVRKSIEDSGETVLKTIHMFLMKSSNFLQKDPLEKTGWYEMNYAINHMAFKEEAEFLKKHKEELL